ncbi:MAG: cell-cell cohesion protein MtsF [Hyalangium sp.]|uniref:cell-cell cohesion protein MtsF n=1 Tax=Hyalangium sp. TaxID=2028555 RepID=UPI003899BF20
MSRLARLLPLASLLVLAACPGGGSTEPDAGDGLPPDLCNSKDEALTLPDCQLTLGQQVERYISFAGDQDWYSVQIPATANARTLVRVTAGYLASSTAVNLSVNLQRSDGTQGSLKTQVDAHGQGAPKPVEIILPFSEPNARLLLLLEDKPAIANHPQFDARSPYFLKVEVLDNPDLNEPNDTQAQATPLTLSQGPIQAATSSGYLATTDDVDRFTFNLAANKVAYVHLFAEELRPPPPYRLSYKLLRPDGTAEAEGQVANATIATDLATARKVKSAGTWTVVVQGYRPAGNTDPIEGSLLLKYNLDVRVMDEQDPQDTNGDNDIIDRALVRTIGGAPGSSTAFSGRIGSVPDPDWYGVDVPASAQPTVLYFHLTQGSGGGRFPPLPGLVDREVRVFSQVTAGATVADRRQSCKTDKTACPKGYGEVPTAQTLVEAYCNNSQPEPLCLYASREEEPVNFPNLHNFEGAIPVPPHSGTARYYFLVQDESNNWADDKDYNLEVTWLADTDDANRYASGVEQPSTATLASDPSASTFPAPPNTATQLTGELNYGFGRLQPADRLTGKGLRGPTDYDAVPSDVDSFILNLPTGLPDPQDRTWEVQWTVENLADGGLPHGLALDLTFCDGKDGGSTCTPVSTGSQGAPLTLAFRPDPLRAWYSPSGSLSGLQPLYSKKVVAGNPSSTVFTVLPYACSCLEPRFIKGGTLRVDVSGTERTSYDRVGYSVSTAYTNYPLNYSVDGGTKTCPAPPLDGGAGCKFTLQP